MIDTSNRSTQLLSVTITNYHRRENHQVARLELILELNVKARSRGRARVTVSHEYALKNEVACWPGRASIHRTGHIDGADVIARCVYDVDYLG